MAAFGVNRRVLKLLLNPWLRRSKVKRFVTAGKLVKLIIFNLLKETKNQTQTRPPTLVYALAKGAPNSILITWPFNYFHYTTS